MRRTFDGKDVRIELIFSSRAWSSDLRGSSSVGVSSKLEDSSSLGIRLGCFFLSRILSVEPA